MEQPRGYHDGDPVGCSVIVSTEVSEEHGDIIFRIPIYQSTLRHIQEDRDHNTVMERFNILLLNDLILKVF